MKWLVIFLLVSALFVAAQEKVTFIPGKSYVIDDRNITLVRLNEKDETAVFCVNGIKGIVIEDEIKSVNDVYITATRIDSLTVDTELDYRCNDCVCGESCNNQVCFEDAEEEPSDVEIIEEDETEDEVDVIEDDFSEEVSEPSEVKVIEKPNVGMIGVIFAVLIVVVIALGLFIFWKRN